MLGELGMGPAHCTNVSMHLGALFVVVAGRISACHLINLAHLISRDTESSVRVILRLFASPNVIDKWATSTLATDPRAQMRPAQVHLSQLVIACLGTADGPVAPSFIRVCDSVVYVI